MNKKFFFLAVLIFVTSFAQVAYARSMPAGNSIIPHNGFARVLEVIDGESMRVQFLATEEVALVRMLGVDARGFDESVHFLRHRLMGRIVLLEFDGGVISPEGRWNVMYVYLDDNLVNAELLELGFAQLNPAHSGASLYWYFQRDETVGRHRELNLWSPQQRFFNPVVYRDGYISEGININTATAWQFQTILYGVDWGLARDIVHSRDRWGYFRTIDEIMDVRGFTRELFVQNRRLMTVSTNINTASLMELLTLDISYWEADDIIYFRQERRFTSVRQLYDEGFISWSSYRRNARFMDVTPRARIFEEEEEEED